ncbi:hypothetical protein [Streptomyces xylophagus]|uniref:hypothetical protein n=1 Tax=Streptomyces xylophagus TaxID=285514 RepID=UPI00131A98DA|nr:hypothetical protein [Streptomyces xylophagus]
MIQQLRFLTRIVTTFLIGGCISLVRRIENARTPAPIWNDPGVISAVKGDTLQGSDARQASRIAEITGPNVA